MRKVIYMNARIVWSPWILIAPGYGEAYTPPWWGGVRGPDPSMIVWYISMVYWHMINSWWLRKQTISDASLDLPGCGVVIM